MGLNLIRNQYEATSMQDIAKSMMKRIQKFVKKDKSNYEFEFYSLDGLRTRYDLVTKRDVVEAIKISIDVLNELEMPGSRFTIVSETIKILRRIIKEVYLSFLYKDSIPEYFI